MNLDILLKQVKNLPLHRQQEVIDFVEFIYSRESKQASERKDSSTEVDWSEETFKSMSLGQALRGMEDEEELYSESDLKERWQ